MPRASDVKTFAILLGILTVVKFSLVISYIVRKVRADRRARAGNPAESSKRQIAARPLVDDRPAIRVAGHASATR
jgi:hypothetical protein